MGTFQTAATLGSVLLRFGTEGLRRSKSSSYHPEPVATRRVRTLPPLPHPRDKSVDVWDVPGFVRALLHAGARMMQQRTANISPCFRRWVTSGWGTDDRCQLVDELLPFEISREVPDHILRHGPLAVPAPTHTRRNQPHSRAWAWQGKQGRRWTRKSESASWMCVSISHSCLSSSMIASFWMLRRMSSVHTSTARPLPASAASCSKVRFVKSAMSTNIQ